MLSKEEPGNVVHNMRAAFIIGLAHGMNKATCILQYNNDLVPIDYRDFVNIYYSINDIDTHIAEFVSRVAEAFQESGNVNQDKVSTYLQQIDLGASAAENEMRDLRAYYLKTDAYNKTLRGDVQLVVGRKGSGKTAIFLQIRDKERDKSGNIVLDLKPEGYKLIKFKELVFSYMQQGTFQHTISAFWEYIILLEVCHKVLESDRNKHMNDYPTSELYKNLESMYKAEGYSTEGDFSERMSKVMDNLATSYKSKYGIDLQVRLSTPQITDLIYKSDIRNLRSVLVSYLKKKNKIWVLLDNIDKGWPSSGLQAEDLIIIRTLIDALRNIQRQFDRERIDMYPVVFLRNDVYELLIEKTADRQKESKEVLDWVDPDLLREIIKLRLLSNQDISEKSFEDAWRSVCVSHYKGEETSQYMIERSLMRPRFLINLINQCKSYAVNFSHKKIESEDIEKGFNSYSYDLLIDINYEIRDVLPEAEDVLYNFISSKSELNYDQLLSLVSQSGDEEVICNRISDLLLWYGFLGIRLDTQEVRYIFNFNYNMNLMKGLINKNKEHILFVINPAFWPSLFIEEISKHR